MYKIVGPFTWFKEKGGDGYRRNIGEPIPEKLFEDKELVKELVRNKRIAEFDDKTGKRIDSTFDYVTLSDGDIEYMSKNFHWNALVDEITNRKIDKESLHKLHMAVSLNVNMHNRDSVLQAIENKLKIDSPQEGKNVEKKNTGSK
ncbi:MAG: hypothetical protein WC479_05850 [Candidatus Izemoplasmatales bacterium]